MAPRRVDLTGKVFGRLTVLRFSGSNVHGKSVYDCACSCGENVTVVGSSLSAGVTKSCGRHTKGTKSRNGVSYLRAYTIWEGMLSRCRNPKAKDYKNYGGRGISVCEEWLKFGNFHSDMGDPPERMQIDRVDNDKGYYKENCRWVSNRMNSLNRRSTRKVEWEGRTQYVVDLLPRYGIKSHVYDSRKRKGWTTEDCFLVGA